MGVHQLPPFGNQEKLWLVNGTHGLIALLTLYDNKRSLPDFLRLPPDENYPTKQRLPFKNTHDKQRAVRRILQEFALGFRYELERNSGQGGHRFLDAHFSPEAEEQYIHEIYQRFSTTLDVPDRIISRFTAPNAANPGQLSTFLARFTPRISSPIVNHIARLGQAPRESTAALLRLMELVERQEYVELGQPPPQKDFGF